MLVGVADARADVGTAVADDPPHAAGEHAEDRHRAARAPDAG
jgi:hypothetical protein